MVFSAEGNTQRQPEYAVLHNNQNGNGTNQPTRPKTPRTMELTALQPQLAAGTSATEAHASAANAVQNSVDTVSTDTTPVDAYTDGTDSERQQGPLVASLAVDLGARVAELPVVAATMTEHALAVEQQPVPAHAQAIGLQPDIEVIQPLPSPHRACRLRLSPLQPPTSTSSL